ncbi:hypothetical protein, partial [Xanthomonas oryzae]|uniref:hypothetical protein n=1 Tax=Xanthomonas oryzae TaxID=347 RepID=UPI001C4A08D7
KKKEMKTGNSSTPKTQMKPCNGCGLGVFQGRLNTQRAALRGMRKRRTTRIRMQKTGSLKI